MAKRFIFLWLFALSSCGSNDATPSHKEAMSARLQELAETAKERGSQPETPFLERLAEIVPESDDPEADRLSVKLTKLEISLLGSVGKLAERVEALEATVHELEESRDVQRNINQRLLSPVAEPKELDLLGGSYAMISNDHGGFVVSVESVSPFADGAKIKLRVGNLMGANFTDCSLDASWGVRRPVIDPNGPVNWHALTVWRTSLQSQSFALSEELLAGAWTTVEIGLPGLDPAKLGHLEVALSTAGVSLRR